MRALRNHASSTYPRFSARRITARLPDHAHPRPIGSLALPVPGVHADHIAILPVHDHQAGLQDRLIARPDPFPDAGGMDIDLVG